MKITCGWCGDQQGMKCDKCGSHNIESEYNPFGLSFKCKDCEAFVEERTQTTTICERCVKQHLMAAGLAE